MATIREFFDSDFSRVMNVSSTVNVAVTRDKSTPVTYEIPSRVHYDFDSGTKFISFFVPSSPDSLAFCENLIFNPQLALEPAKSLQVKAGFPGERTLDAAELKFSGRIFIYAEDPIPIEKRTDLETKAKSKGLDLIVRTAVGAKERSKYEKPLAFISHDSRDKKEIAQPIALGLIKMGYPVWYDEYSLKVGDKLRDSIEKGLKESRKCILILSSHFLSNTGWTKTEFDSIFTRQILEKSNVVLPVWCGVTKQQIYEYSPSLLDNVAVKWEEGIEEVLRKLVRAIGVPPAAYNPVHPD